MQERRKILGLRSSAIFETIAFLLIALVIDFIVFDGHRFFSASPHPYWVVILLIAVQYGTVEALFATTMSSIALLAFNIPEQQLDSDFYEYLLYLTKNPIMWLTASVIIGEIRERHKRERDLMSKQLEDASNREETITKAYNQTKGLKENLELKIAGQLRSSIEAYRAAKAIERLTPSEVLNGIDSLVSSVLHPEKFSVYILSAKGLECVITSGWTDTDKFQKTFDSKSVIYNEIVGRHATLCLINSDHQRILGDHGMLAGALTNPETGEVLGMLKIEKIGFLDLNLNTIETFTAICEWLGLALSNARSYDAAKSESIINPEHKLMSYSYFRRYADYIAALGKRVGFDVTMVVIKLSNTRELEDSDRKRIAISVSEAVNETLRNVDLAFDHEVNGEDFAIVLPATDSDGAKIVINKIMKSLQTSLGKTLAKANLTYSLHTLNSTVEAKN